MRARRLGARSLVVTVLLLTSACVGKLGNTERFTDAATCPDDFQAAILTPRCGLEGCHVPYEPTLEKAVLPQTDDIYAALVDLATF